MQEEPRQLIVTNADTPLGYSVLRNASFSGRRADFSLVGLVREEKAFGGNHLCDSIVPSSDTLAWLTEPASPAPLAALVIPTKEVETVSNATLPSYMTLLACSPQIAGLFFDKYLTAQAFREAGVMCAPTLLPSEFIKGTTGPAADPLWAAGHIVKPRLGAHSVTVTKNPVDLSPFPDEHFVVQPLLRGPELTSALYFDRMGKLHASITFLREFVPQGSNYEVAPQFDAAVEEIGRKLGAVYPLRGSLNVQSIVLDGSPIPFEVNGRMSSSNMLRRALGFPDLEWAIGEYLFHQPPEPAQVTVGSAVTTRIDAIYPGRKLSEVSNEDIPLYR